MQDPKERGSTTVGVSRRECVLNFAANCAFVTATRSLLFAWFDFDLESAVFAQNRAAEGTVGLLATLHIRLVATGTLAFAWFGPLSLWDAVWTNLVEDLRQHPRICLFRSLESAELLAGGAGLARQMNHVAHFQTTEPLLEIVECQTRAGSSSRLSIQLNDRAAKLYTCELSNAHLADKVADHRQTVRS